MGGFYDTFECPVCGGEGECFHTYPEKNLDNLCKCGYALIYKNGQFDGEYFPVTLGEEEIYINMKTDQIELKVSDNQFVNFTDDDIDELLDGLEELIYRRIYDLNNENNTVG